MSLGTVYIYVYMISTWKCGDGTWSISYKGHFFVMAELEKNLSLFLQELLGLIFILIRVTNHYFFYLNVRISTGTPLSMVVHCSCKRQRHTDWRTVETPWLNILTPHACMLSSTTITIPLCFSKPL